MPNLKRKISAKPGDVVFVPIVELLGMHAVTILAWCRDGGCVCGTRDDLLVAKTPDGPRASYQVPDESLCAQIKDITAHAHAYPQVQVQDTHLGVFVHFIPFEGAPPTVETMLVVEWTDQLLESY